MRKPTLVLYSAALMALLECNTTVAEDTTRNFAAEAVSGAGSRKTGFAGSFALNRVDNSATAQASGAALHVGGGALNIAASNTASHTAKATPAIPTTRQ